MPRAALSPDEVEEFRDALCEAATRLFGAHGYAGVTLRALAGELGCSPMTPYRYFDNKAAIFAAVREASFARFAQAQQSAAATAREPVAKLRALCEAYVRFAIDEPAAYRIMFELDPPEDEVPHMRSAEHASWTTMRDVVAEAVATGVLRGDPDIVAHLLWSGVHGLVSLHLAGKLVLGATLDDLLEPFIQYALPRAASAAS